MTPARAPAPSILPVDGACSNAELSQIWDAVGRLHAHKVTHRGLTADRILLTGDGQVLLLDPGGGDVAASDLQIRLDLAQLITELALAVGPDRAAGLALAKMSSDDLVAVVSLLQPVALARPTRGALRRARDVLPALRTKLLSAVPGGGSGPGAGRVPDRNLGWASGGWWPLRHGLGLFLGDLPQVRLPVRLVLVHGSGECRSLFLGHLRLSLCPHGLGLRGLLPGPFGLRLDPFGLPRVARAWRGRLRRRA